MASNALTFTLSPGMAPAAPLMRMLARFDRAKVEAFAEVSIALLDLMDGDPDAETGNDVEDDFVLSANAIERAINEPRVDFVDFDAGAYVEWQKLRGRQKGGHCQLAGHEDDEEDDPSGQYDEDYYTGPAMRGGGPGCAISDPGGCEHDGREHEDVC